MMYSRSRLYVSGDFLRRGSALWRGIVLAVGLLLLAAVIALRMGGTIVEEGGHGGDLSLVVEPEPSVEIPSAAVAPSSMSGASVKPEDRVLPPVVLTGEEPSMDTPQADEVLARVFGQADARDAEVGDEEALGPIVEFSHWLAQWHNQQPTDLAAGLALAKERRQIMRQLVADDPEQALRHALSPRTHSRLPPEILPLVEQPLVAEGFYGVVTSCNHGPDENHGVACQLHYEVVLGMGTFTNEVYRASIYGQRHYRSTEEEASLYGVIIDGVVALHESDVVLIDDGPQIGPERYAVYYRGQEQTFADQQAALQFAQSLIP